jgi:hypothetical protein
MPAAPTPETPSKQKPKPSSRNEFAGVYQAIVPDPLVRYGWRAVTLFVRPDGSMRLEQSAREQPRDLILAETVTALEDMADRVFQRVHRFRIAEASAKADAGRLVIAADAEQRILAAKEEERKETRARELDAQTAASSTKVEADQKRYSAMAEVYRQDGEVLDASMHALEEAIAAKELAYNELLNTARKCTLAAEAAEAELYL